MKIKEILALDYEVESEYFGIDEQVLYTLTGNVGNSYLRIDTIEGVEVRQYIDQKGLNDNRSRYLYCIYYKDTPMILFQYTGKGNYGNIFPLESELYSEFKQKLTATYIEENEPETVFYTEEEDIPVNTYGLDYKVENNKIKCF